MTAIYDDELMTLDIHEETSTLRLLWKPATKNMSNQSFQLALALFAAEAVSNRVRNLMVDVRQFAHKGFEKVEDWRQRSIIPLYNRSSVTKFAYILPAPAELKPVREASEREAFTTGFFHSDADALQWYAQG